MSLKKKEAEDVVVSGQCLLRYTLPNEKATTGKRERRRLYLFIINFFFLQYETISDLLLPIL